VVCRGRRSTCRCGHIWHAAIEGQRSRTALVVRSGCSAVAAHVSGRNAFAVSVLVSRFECRYSDGSSEGFLLDSSLRVGARVRGDLWRLRFQALAVKR
jgi:hypothetical protein